MHKTRFHFICSFFIVCDEYLYLSEIFFMFSLNMQFERFDCLEWVVKNILNIFLDLRFRGSYSFWNSAKLFLLNKRSFESATKHKFLNHRFCLQDYNIITIMHFLKLYYNLLILSNSWPINLSNWKHAQQFCWETFVVYVIKVVRIQLFKVLSYKRGYFIRAVIELPNEWPDPL